MLENRHARLDAVSILAITGLCALWGVSQVFVKIANAGISPMLQAGLRSIGATVLLLLWAWARGVPLFYRDGSFWFGMLVAALFAGEFSFINWGLVFTTASRGVLFVYVAPFVVAAGAHWLIPGERLRVLQVIGFAAAFAGLALAFDDALHMPDTRQLVGDALVVGGALFWGATTVVVKASRLARLSATKVLFYQLAGSAVMLPLLSGVFGEAGITAPTKLVLGALAFQTAVIAFASYLAWFWLVAHYPAARLSAFSFLTPLFGLMAGVVLLGEPLTATLVAAILLVGLGIYLVNRPAPRAPAGVAGSTAATAEPS